MTASRRPRAVAADSRRWPRVSRGVIWGVGGRGWGAKARTGSPGAVVVL